MIDPEHKLPITRQAKLLEIARSPHSVLSAGEAITKYGSPEIMQGAQGSQFTSLEFTETLKAHGIAIIMKSKSCWGDNVLIERFWKSINYEEFHLKAYECISQARESISHYMAFYINRRPHRSLEGSAPHTIYFVETTVA